MKPNDLINPGGGKSSPGVANQCRKLNRVNKLTLQELVFMNQRADQRIIRRTLSVLKDRARNQESKARYRFGASPESVDHSVPL